MSTRDLFELASLDALGLLDESEREGFERAFRAAPPHVQAQVRRQQLHFTQIDDLLPDVAPPPGLKARVMAAVRQAIHAVASEGPVARIGRGSSFSAFMNFAPMWRAACIGFATASLVLGWFLMGFAAESRRMEQLGTGDAIQEAMAAVGLDYAAIAANPLSTRIEFAPLAMDADPLHQAGALLAVESQGRRGTLMCVNLPRGRGTYALVVEGDGIVGQMRRVQFEANGSAFQAVPVPDIDVNEASHLVLIHESDPEFRLVARAL